ncbi:metal-dependent amidase/aminoacylase/carboxypeptidase [Dactylonectria estremocensis]|uniref:Peptidase M20 domain-containing protein 2 n=1 Tax=Dactylonectria estremocensis TaxID=1079267 RepID=A0A9P9DMN7_9HYPO|nr:metal-dependent amidase/aminoacylase/carboxypeptidase [Dactylonectria estremocensis]
MVVINLSGPPATIDERDDIARGSIFGVIDDIDEELRELNTAIHDHPELCYKEFKAHENITSFLKRQGLDITPHAYGLETSFLAEYGQGGRLVIFCAEYDALEGVGHACGHNLIATASIAAFLGVVAAIKTSQAPGRVRLLGCPAEEGGGGKIKLIEAGAFEHVDAALMLHPTPPEDNMPNLDGISYGTCLAGCVFKVTFTGKAAHAGAMPWLGNNALDAATLSYNAVSMLRQQIMPTDRINIIIREGGLSSNIIADKTSIEACTRSATLKHMISLTDRVYKCFEGAAIATGCQVEIIKGMDPYADLRPNEALCSSFAGTMATEFDKKYYCDLSRRERGGYGTDMGNVSYECPSFHGNFCIPVLPGDNIHGPGFERAAGTEAAHQTATQAAKGMGATGWRVLADEAFAQQVHDDFELDRQRR